MSIAAKPLGLFGGLPFEQVRSLQIPIVLARLRALWRSLGYGGSKFFEGPDGPTGPAARKFEFLAFRDSLVQPLNLQHYHEFEVLKYKMFSKCSTHIGATF